MGIRLSDYVTDDLILSDEDIYKSFIQAGYEVELNDEFKHLKEPAEEYFKFNATSVLEQKYENIEVVKSNISYSSLDNSINNQKYTTSKTNKKYDVDYRQAAAA